jgi:hypothetical protein
MFFRVKPSGPRRYLQIVENQWVDGRSRQRVVATLGRLDHLQQEGRLESLLASGARWAQQAMLLTALDSGQLDAVTRQRFGPVAIFERLWRDTGCGEIIRRLLTERHFEFAVERAVFLTVLHRLLVSGSDRAADKWKADYALDGVAELQLHHLYRAMAWLGETLPDDQQRGSTRLVALGTKDRIEEGIFQCRRDLFTNLDVVFFDTTSIYFEGDGGDELGQYGHSKDHRPDLKQMVVGAVLDGDGRPICCEMWPGNTTDVKTLIPIVDGLYRRFGVVKVCIIADRGMISQETINDLDQQGWPYILGARMRRCKEVRDQVLNDRGRFHVVHPKSPDPKDPSPLKVKEVRVEGRRYVVCVNEDEVKKDRADREAILAGLRAQLHQGDKSLVGNKGYRRFLKAAGPGHFTIDDAKIAEEARYDGTWVLRTSTALPTAEVALQFKRLWQVEHWFRACKSLLETRPIYHQRDETIRGHVFCSFLALLLRYELQARLRTKSHAFEWADVLQDLDALEYVDVTQEGKRFRLRTDPTGTCARVFQAVGVALPPRVQQLA